MPISTTTTTKPEAIPPGPSIPAGTVRRIKQVQLRPTCTVRIGNMTYDGNLNPVRSEHSKLRLYDTDRFLTVQWVGDDGRREIRDVPWDHVQWLEPAAPGT